MKMKIRNLVVVVAAIWSALLTALPVSAQPDQGKGSGYGGAFGGNFVGGSVSPQYNKNKSGKTQRLGAGPGYLNPYRYGYGTGIGWGGYGYGLNYNKSGPPAKSFEKWQQKQDRLKMSLPRDAFVRQYR